MGAVDALGPVLSYPAADYLALVEAARAALLAEHPAEADVLAAFRVEAGALSAGEREELFCRTFDLNPVCALEVGWHLYGEDYKRGEFLARLRAELAAHGLAEGTELADHLVHLLPLLERMAPDRAEELGSLFVVPAVRRMADGLAASDNPYRHVLSALLAVLTTRYPAVEEVVA